ncbi:MAG: tetratricopeptide repeat protein [Candidatus Obscuribacterales bacterium]|nr:tetratricopeptide repeat protein [Candidatus Obscuribacterales bacterium]
MTSKAAPKANANLVKEGPIDAILLALAGLYEQIGQIESALSVYDSILKRNPNCVGALLSRSLVYLSKSQDDKAVKDLQKAAARAPRDPNVLRTKAFASMISGDIDSADKDFQKLMENNDLDSLSALIAYALKQKVDETAAPIFLNEALDSKIKVRDWPIQILQFFRGEIDMSEVMAQAFSKTKQLETRAYVGFCKAFSANSQDGKADLQFAYNAKNGSALVRAMAARGLKIIQEGHAQRVASRHEKADKISGVDWMD